MIAVVIMAVTVVDLEMIVRAAGTTHEMTVMKRDIGEPMVTTIVMGMTAMKRVDTADVAPMGEKAEDMVMTIAMTMIVDMAVNMIAVTTRNVMIGEKCEVMAMTIVIVIMVPPSVDQNIPEVRFCVCVCVRDIFKKSLLNTIITMPNRRVR